MKVSRSLNRNIAILSACGLSACVLVTGAMAQSGGSPAAPAGSGSSLLNRNKTRLGAPKASSPAPSRSSAPAPSKSSSPLNRTSKLGKMMMKQSMPGGAWPSSSPAVPISGTGDSALREAGSLLTPDRFDRGVYQPEDNMLSVSDGVAAKAVVGAIVRNDPVLSSTEDVRVALLKGAMGGTLQQTGQDVRDELLKGPEEVANVQAMRDKMVAEHFMAVELNEDYTAYIKANNWCEVHVAADMLRDRYGLTASQPGSAYERDWIYRGDYFGRRSDDIIYGTDAYRRGYSDDTPSSLRTRYGSMSPVSGLPRDAFVAGVARQADEAAIVRADSFEQGIAHLQRGKYRDAAASLQKYVEGETEDAAAIRVCGIAKLLAGQIRAGIDDVYRAYTTDSALCDEAFDATILAEKNAERALRELTQRVVTLAGGSKSPDESFVAAVLMQTQGKPDAARRLLKKATEKGLNERLGTWMEAALGPDIK